MVEVSVDADILENEDEPNKVDGQQCQRQGSLYDIIDGAIYDAELLRLADSEALAANGSALDLGAAKRLWETVDEEGVNEQIWEVSLRTIKYIAGHRTLDISAKTFLQEAVKASIKYWRDREKLDAKMSSSSKAVSVQPVTPLKRIRPQRSMLEISGIENEINEAKTPRQINAAMKKINKWMEGRTGSADATPPKPSIKKRKTRVRMVDGEKHDADLLEMVEAKVQKQGSDHPIDLRTAKQVVARSQIDGIVPAISRRSLQYIAEEYDLNDAASDFIDSVVHVTRKQLPAKGNAKLGGRASKSQNVGNTGAATSSDRQGALTRRRLTSKQSANGMFPPTSIRMTRTRSRLALGKQRKRLRFKQNVCAT